jgi:two-component system, NarL family, sensor histidine kinase UhpB
VPNPDTPAAGPEPNRVARRLLQVPLFYKILLANSAIVLVGMVAASALPRGLVSPGSDLPITWGVLLALGGVAVTILVNAVILRVALSPLKQLEQTAARVQAGDLDARVPYSPLRDRQLERLTGTFNGMLDTLDSYRQRLTGIAARTLNAEEQERIRIARELHDDTAQSLAALLIRLRLLRSIDDPQTRESVIEEFRREVGEALERIRRFARGLRPPALDELGLVPALESHVRALSESVGIAIRLEAEPIQKKLSQQAELALYRIAQEALSNAVRHAEPERVLVRIASDESAVTLTVSDDGCGFALDEVIESEERGLGLFGMKERALYVDGQVTIRSAPGEGTEVRAVIPTGDALGRLR